MKDTCSYDSGYLLLSTVTNSRVRWNAVDFNTIPFDKTNKK